MQLILTAGYTALFLWIIRRSQFFQLQGLPAYFSGGLFVLKVISGCILGYIYTYHYTDRGTSDTIKFFNDSGILFDSLFSRPYDFFRMLTGIGGNAPELRHYYEEMATWLNRDVLFNDNKTIIRVNTVFRFFSLGNYFVHVVFINFLSLTGLIALLKIFLDYCSDRKLEVAILTMMLPSVLFWGSGLLKDGLLIFVFGSLCYIIHRIGLTGFNRKKIISLLLMLFSLLFIKLYVMIIIFPGMMVWLWSRNRSSMAMVIAFVIVYALYFTAAFNIDKINEKYDVADIIYYKQVNFYVQAEENKAGSVIEIPRLEPGIKSIVMNAPAAFFTTLLRPFVTDAKGNKLILISAIENVFILLILLAGIITVKRKPGDGFILFCSTYLFLLFVLIGLITPVLGALVRYRVPGLPILMFLVVYFSGLPKIIPEARGKS